MPSPRKKRSRRAARATSSISKPPATGLAAVDAYVDDVLTGRRIAGKWERLAIERHVRDLEHGHNRGLRFDIEAAQRALGFFDNLTHIKGRWGGTKFVLAGWQQWSIASLFGWLRADGLRRFRIAYIEVARKNGKTTEAAGIGLNLFCNDREPGAEVYCAATKKDQARICWSAAASMVQRSPRLRRGITPFRNNLSIEATSSKFEPLSSDIEGLDGLNVHGAIVDELHAHRTRDVWDLIETATGARTQPLIVAITTAGFNRHSVCYEQHQYVEQILDQVIEDDAQFGVIYAIDAEDAEGDNWTNPTCWGKANPNLGVSITLDELAQKCEKAKKQPSAQNAFKRLRLNVWTESVEKWIDAGAWSECTAPDELLPEFEERLRGRTCYLGLDLASRVDLAALALVFPPERENEPYDVFMRYWIPADNVRDRVERDKVPYQVWLDQGWITGTPGNAVDYAWILAEIDQLARIYDVRQLAFDPWNAGHLVQQLQDRGLECVEIPQQFSRLNLPSKELERLLPLKLLRHDGNPVLAWNIANTVVRHGPNEEIKPDRKKSTEKIDGTVAVIMALSRAMLGDSEEPTYGKRGLA